MRLLAGTLFCMFLRNLRVYLALWSRSGKSGEWPNAWGRRPTPSGSCFLGRTRAARATEHSDVDLLVIADSPLPRFKRSPALYRLLKPYPFSMDLVVYTPAEIEKGRQTPRSLVATALREGKTVYDGR